MSLGRRLGESFAYPQARAIGRFARLRRVLLAADLAAGALAAAAAGSAAGLPLPHTALLAAYVAAAWATLAYLTGLYAREDLHTWSSGVEEAPRILVCMLLLSWPSFALLLALDAPRTALGTITLSATICAAVGIGRAVARARLHVVDDLRERALIVGSGAVAEQLVGRMRCHREFGIDPIGFVDDDAHRAAELGIPRLGGLDALPELLALDRVDRVVIAFTRASHERLHACIRDCRDAGVHVSVVPRLFEFLDGAEVNMGLGGMPLLSIEAPTFSRAARVSKRVLDLVGAAVALVVLAPLLVVIAVAIKLDSGGPVLFSQRRSGRDGRFFTLYKFRSMEPGSTVVVQENGAISKSANDDRVTCVGRLIRRFSLDETPQLFNVLRGDMSLVGPRPLVRAEYKALVERWQGRRADLSPGLTGPWQVSGRSHLSFEEMIKLDYQYAVGWSLGRDLKLLLATVPAVISGRGAY